MARFASQAEYLRHHRKCFEFALERGITPREAETELRLIELRERARARAAMRQRQCGTEGRETHGEPARDFRRWDAPFMLRD